MSAVVEFDLHGRMADVEFVVQLIGDAVQKASPGCPSGVTRWQVSAISVVLIAQMCRS